MQFSQFLRKHRANRTLAALSQKCGVPASNLSALETEKHLPSNIKHILAILDGLDLCRDDFIQGIRCAAYDVNLFSIPVFRGTEPIGMEAVCLWADRYYCGIKARS